MDLIVGCPAQEDLLDNKPEYSFDDGVLEWISKNCPDWNKANIRTTYMIPPTFPDINKKEELRGQLTEKHVFDILQEFGEKKEQSMFVVHSFEFKEVLDSRTSLNSKECTGLEDKCPDGETEDKCPDGETEDKCPDGETEDKCPDGETEDKCPDGDTDFVIIHRKLGVIFFQVKARIKTCHSYGPAVLQLNRDQAAMASFLKQHQLYLEEHGTTVEAELAKCQGFVVMPNCPRDRALGKEGCFKEDIQSVANFEKWWQENVHRTEVFSEDMYKLMAIRFVGTRVATESCLLKDVIDKTHRRIMLWTEDQLKIMTEDVPKQYIAGPAGSGKTLLLLKKAKELAGNLKAHERILIMCFNKPLSLYLKAEFPTAGPVEVQTFAKILQEITGTRDLPKYDHEKRKLVIDCVQILNQMQSNPALSKKYKYEHVFVDEGQDMYGRWMDLVDLLHDDNVGSNEGRRYRWVFFDSNQSVHFGNYLPQEVIDSAKPMHRIVRNTRNIFDCSQKFLSPEVQQVAELDHSIVGKQVKWIDSLPTVTHQVSPIDVLRKGTELVISPCVSDELRKRVELVMQEIKYLDNKSVAMSDIVVLTKDKRERDEVRSLCNIRTQKAEEAILSPDLYAITVDSIRRFKGLERKVVILLDPPIDEEDSVEMDLNYVAMSRCFCYLVIVTSQHKRQRYVEKFAPKESPGRKRKQKSGKVSQKKPRKEKN